MTKNDKVKLFEKELNFIKNPKIKEFASKAVEKVPDYFFEVAASSTGKYHPSYALGDKGLLRHTISCVGIAVELFRVQFFKYDDDMKDLIITCLILHDSRKHGEIKSRYTVAEHPLVAANAIKNDDDINKILTKEQLEIVVNGISSHMGYFNKDYKTNKEILPKPKKGYESFIHLCDYLASRKCLEFNFDVNIERE